MSRPVNADAAATRQRILDVAGRQFADDGLQGATIRGIASEADVNVATVHHYFTSKANLHRCCVVEYYKLFSQLVGEISGPVLEASSPRKSIELAVRLSCRFARKHRRSVHFMQRVLLESGTLGDEVREQFMRTQLLHGSRLSEVFDLSAREARFVMMSVNYLVARYALAEDDELALIADSDASNPAEAHEITEDHIVRVALALFGVD